MPERSDVDEIGIVGMDDDVADLLRTSEPDVLPGLPAIARLEHAIALRDVGSHVRFAGADVDDARIRRRNRDRPNRPDLLIVEDRAPRPARIARFPDAAVHAAKVEVLRLPRHP